MKAVIRIKNSQRGMYAGEMESGEFVVFELLDSTVPEIGDVVTNPDFYSMGSETYKNITQGCEMDVYVQNVCSKSLVRQQCFL